MLAPIRGNSNQQEKKFPFWPPWENHVFHFLWPKKRLRCTTSPTQVEIQEPCNRTWRPAGMTWASTRCTQRCVQISMSVYIYVYLYMIYQQSYKHKCNQVYIYIYIFIYACIPMYIHVHTYISIYQYVHTQRNTQIYIYIYTYDFVSVYAEVYGTTSDPSISVCNYLSIPIYVYIYRFLNPYTYTDPFQSTSIQSNPIYVV